MALTKIDDRGLKTPIDLLDNEKIRFGTHNDLELYHDGSNSFITDAGTGSLKLATNELQLLNAAGNEYYLSGIENGATSLYYDNSKKVETVAGGLLVQGYVSLQGGSNAQVYIEDNGKLNVGSSHDLQIFHDGSNSYIRDATAGHLRIENDNIRLRNGASNETMITGTVNDSVQLYYDNSNKLQTISTGVQINGNLNVPTGDVQLNDNRKLRFGNGQDLDIYHDGTNTHLNNGTGGLYIRNENIYLRGNATDEVLATFNANGSVELYQDNSLRIHTTGSGMQVKRASDVTTWVGLETSGGTCGYLVGQSNAGSGSEKAIAFYNAAGNETLLRGITDGGVELYYNNSKKFETQPLGVNITGNLDLVDNDKIRLGTASDLQLYHDGSNSYIKDTGTGNLVLAASELSVNNAASNEEMIKASQNGAVQLFYDNSLRLTTQAWGTGFDANFGGNDNIKLNLGNGDDFQIYHDGTSNLIRNVGSVDMYINLNTTEVAIKCEANGKVELYHNNSLKLFTQSWGAQVAGNFLPDGDNSRNLGASNERWANVYSADMHLNNTGAGGNEVDGSEGSWTIQEGANDLFLLNRTNGKKYKFNLTEVS